MNRLPCQYAIVRFLPYAETGEFANVGVVLACPATGYLAARLMPTKRTRRITDFFDQLDARVYRHALKYLGEELERLRQLAFLGAEQGRNQAVQNLFVDLTRPREAVLRFSDARVVLADDPEAMLEQLFARFVERDFADKQYHDRLLVRGVREVLGRANLKEYFKPEEIGDEYLHIQIPFVHLRDGVPILAIKPLDLAKGDPNQVFDHGGHWVDRVRRLRKHNLLTGRMLFAVREPDPAEVKAKRAAEEIEGELRENGVEVARINDANTIARFAKAALH